VLFSGGLYRTESTERRFLSIIHAANRASVAVYAIEADGLSPKSFEYLTGAEIQSVAATSRARREAGDDRAGAPSCASWRGRRTSKYSSRASL
jgi:hypothetical protein